MSRVILHADLNNFYASVECLHRPFLQGKPVAVCGDPSLRHGIVLAKNQLAKQVGIKTGEVIWQARQKAANLIVLPPNYQLYLRFARLARSIYCDYSDRIEPFGLDEAWIDVSDGKGADGQKIADEIRARMKAELGVSASVGVADNKIFAKLGSDMKKPDATTVIEKENFQKTVWQLPASDLLYVGRATTQKFQRRNILTIGDIANTKKESLRSLLGKWGEVLWLFANGLDDAPVARMGEESLIKSIGNSTTTPHDLTCEQDVKLTMYVLAESVAERLREHGFLCQTVQIHVRDCDLAVFERQVKLRRATNLSSEIAACAMALFRENYDWQKPVRSIGVRGADLVGQNGNLQLSLFEDEEKRVKQEQLERAIDDIRRRFGHFSLQRGILLKDREIGMINPKGDHTIHPVSYF